MKLRFGSLCCAHAALALSCGAASDGTSALAPGTPTDAAAPMGSDASTDASTDASPMLQQDAMRSTADAGVDAAPPHRTRTLIYVGAADSKIHVLSLDRSTAALTPVAAYAAGNFPSFLAFDVPRRRVFATNENAGAVAAFTLDPTTGALSPNGTVSAGSGTTHISLDATGSFLFAANYGGASAAVLPVRADGSLGAATQTLTTGANPHCMIASPSNAFAFLVVKGADTIAQYAFDATMGTLSPNAVAPVVKTAAGAGPRHLTFHPNGAFAYLIDENDSTMMAFTYDAAAGTLTNIQTLSSRAPNAVGANTGAEVQVARSGSFVYASNRGDDDVVTFAVDPASGKLAFASSVATGGNTPRHFSLDEADGLALVANQGSGNVVAFRVDGKTGVLTKATDTPIGAAPYFVEGIALPAP